MKRLRSRGGEREQRNMQNYHQTAQPVNNINTENTYKAMQTFKPPKMFYERNLLEKMDSKANPLGSVPPPHCFWPKWHLVLLVSPSFHWEKTWCSLLMHWAQRFAFTKIPRNQQVFHLQIYSVPNVWKFRFLWKSPLHLVHSCFQVGKHDPKI